jgi:hypothetical protein
MPSTLVRPQPPASGNRSSRITPARCSATAPAASSTPARARHPQQRIHHVQGVDQLLVKELDVPHLLPAKLGDGVPQRSSFFLETEGRFPAGAGEEGRGQERQRPGGEHGVGLESPAGAFAGAEHSESSGDLLDPPGSGDIGLAGAPDQQLSTVSGEHSNPG